MEIEYDDKDDSLPTSNPKRLWRDTDANEVKTVVNANALAMWNHRGDYDQSENDNEFPDSDGSGSGGVIQAFNTWITTTTATFDGEEWPPKTILIAIINQPGQDPDNWRLI